MRGKVSLPANLFIMMTALACLFVMVSAGGGNRIVRGIQTGDEASLGKTEIAKWKDNKKAAFTLQFDDSMTTHAEKAIPLMIEKGLVGTFYVNPDPRSSPFEQYPDVWRERAITSGQELANHGMTHGDWAGNRVIENYKNADWEIGQCARVIWDIYAQHYTDRSKLLSFCFPGGTDWRISKDEEQKIFKKYHLVHRPEHGCVEDASEEGMFKEAQRALDSGEWKGICFHGVGGQWSSGGLDQFIGFLHLLVSVQDELWIGTNIAVHKYIEERNTAKVTVLAVNKNEIRVRLTCSRDAGLYDEPLTLITDVPDQWTSCTVTQDSQARGCLVEKGYLKYEAVPDRGEVVIGSGAGSP